MRLLALLAFLAPLAAAEELTGACGSAFHAAFPDGGSLRLQIRPGDTDITGTDSAQVRISCEVDPERADEAGIRFRRDGRKGELRVWGGPRNHFRVRIEVPRHTHLWVRSPAGNLSASGVVGDKDMELYAGNLRIEVGDPNAYDRIDGSLYAGDLHATAFRVVKGGLFRSFSRENQSGRYRLHAHVGAGNIVLR